MLGEINILNLNFASIKYNEEEYYVHTKNTLDAHNKDIVEFEIYEYRGKKEAKVISIYKRYTDEFVGRINNSKSFSFVRIETFKEDVYVAKKNNMNAKEGDLVKIKIFYWGNNKRKPEARVVRVIGSSDIAENIIEEKMENQNVRIRFSKEVLNEKINIQKDENRVNLENLYHITIDGEDTKDIDDAIYLEKKDNKYILYVSIADVSAYVKEKSLIDEEAKLRANSIYLYNKSIPMLPRFLTNDKCSLNPNEKKLVFTVKIVFNEKANVIEHEFMKSSIVSKQKLSYNKVNDILNNVDKKNYEYRSMLFDMQELSEKLSEKANNRGSIEFEIPEIKLILDDKDKIKDIKLRKREKAEILIENFMISANEQVAIYMFNNEIPSIYRIHEKPEIESMYALNQELNKIGLSVKNPANLVNKLQKIISKSKHLKFSYTIHKLILKSMKKAIYSKENKGHFGLALQNYLHFTSPIRRYSDLVVHRYLARSIKNYMGEKEKYKISKKLNAIAKHLSIQERQAQKIEYMARDIKLAEYMKDKINEVYEATVSSLYEDKVFVILENYIEALLENGGTYNIGDSIKVVITKVDVYKGKIYVKRSK